MHNVAVADDLAELLAAVDPAELGARIRHARVTAGLTQGQLADGDVSIGHVSRIESGTRRPELALLERLAERLRVSPLVLLTGGQDPALTQLRVALDHAELSLRGGSPVEAQQQLEAVLPELEERGASDLVRRARLTLALSQEALGRLDDAILVLEDLLAGEPVPTRHTLRAAVALSRCYRESGDMTRAVETGERQLEELRRLGLDGSDEAVQLAVTVAAAHFHRGDVGHAARLCQRAVQEAEALGTPVAKASAYWNASIMEAQRGSVDAAVALAGKALRLLESDEDNRNLARLRTELGILQLRLDPPQVEEACAALEAAEAQYLWSSASPVDTGRNAVTFARARLLAGELDEAETRAAAVLEQLAGTAPLVTGSAHTLLGEVAARRGDAQGAARHYRAAVHELTRVGSDRDAAQAWFELGALLDELGLEGEARDAYRSAAAATGVLSVRSALRSDERL